MTLALFARKKAVGPGNTPDKNKKNIRLGLSLGTWTDLAVAHHTLKNALKRHIHNISRILKVTMIRILI